jgi:hypothetical protein
MAVGSSNVYPVVRRFLIIAIEYELSNVTALSAILEIFVQRNLVVYSQEMHVLSLKMPAQFLALKLSIARTSSHTTHCGHYSPFTS